MANRQNQNHALCLLASAVIITLIPTISFQVPESILAPFFLLHTLSLLRDVFSCDPRILFLFIWKSVCPEFGFCLHWIRYAGVISLSEISNGLWKLSLWDKVRPPKPPWMSSTFCAFWRHWDRITIFKLCAMRIAIVVQTNGEVDQRRLRCFVKEYTWNKFGLELFLHRSYTADLVYTIVSNHMYNVIWMGNHESSPNYLQDASGFGFIGLNIRLWISKNPNSFCRMEKLDCALLLPIKEKYLRQRLWKIWYFGMKDEPIVSNRKQYQRLISKKTKLKSNPHIKTRLRKCWYPIVIASELILESLGLTMQCALWRSSQEKLSKHTIRIRARSSKEKENIGSNKSIASKAYLRKASSISLLFVYLLILWRIYLLM